MSVQSVFQSVRNQSFYGVNGKQRLHNSSKDSKGFVQNLSLLNSLKIHQGCVNTISWNHNGSYILSGSDDQNIIITNPYNSRVMCQFKTSHRANIFSAKFMPQSNDTGIISCSGDGTVIYTELSSLQNPETIPPNTYNFNCHSSGTTYEVLTIPTECKSFMSCGEDGTVRLFDLRAQSSCQKTCCKDNILIFSPSAVTSMSLSPITNNYIAVGSSDSQIRIYDRRFLNLIDFGINETSNERHTIPVKVFTIPSLEKRPFRVTSLNYSSDEKELLVSYSSDHLYLFDVTKDGIDLKQANETAKMYSEKSQNSADSSVPVRRLRLRGDWSDTGPEARPERELAHRASMGQARPQLQATIMSRMTEVLSRMLADPRTRMGLNAQGNELNYYNRLPVSFAANYIENSGPSTSSGEIVNTDGINQLKVEGHHQDENLSNVTEDNLPEISDILMNLYHDYMKMKFTGHRNARTIIKEATFWGEDYIMSGSDCGHVFTWDRKTGKLVMLMEGDQHVVNCLQPHPTLPYLATSGIDYDVKIWAPIEKEDNSQLDEEKARDLMERNAVMLEETKDTITVPAAFMIRMLACIHSIRQRPANNINTAINHNSGGNDET